jgi:hypothetical protein
MKPTSILYPFFLIVLLACDKEDEVIVEPEINVVVTGTSITEGFPYQGLKVKFDNPEFRKFEVFFGDKASLLNSQTSQSGSSDGMMAVIPASFPEDTEVQITLKADGKTFTAPGLLKVKALPKVTYVSSNKTGFRQPVKVVVKNKEYFNNGSPEISFCSPSFCSGTNLKTNGDTLLVTPSLLYANSNYNATYTLKIAGNLPPNSDYNFNPIESITGSTPISFRPSYKFNVYKGKPGDAFTIIFDNAKYFANEMTLKFGETIVTPTGSDIAGGEGYVNALAGNYKVPALAPGTYTVSVTDKENMEYLPEAGIKFVIE